MGKILMQTKGLRKTFGTFVANDNISLAIEEGCPLVGQTIASVHFWNNTGATIIAIRRKGSTILSPGPHAQFFAGDHILIVGDEAAYQKTRQLLDERVQ